MRDVIFLIVIVGQTSGLPVAKPPVSWLLGAGHPEDALTGRPEACPTFAPHSSFTWDVFLNSRKIFFKPGSQWRQQLTQLLINSLGLLPFLERLG